MENESILLLYYGYAIRIRYIGRGKGTRELGTIVMERMQKYILLVQRMKPVAALLQLSSSSD